MAILAGIDEAGLGPILGPLVVSGAVFRVPDDRSDICLWKALSESCTRKPRDARRRVVVADSKQVHRPKKGLGPIERTALIMLASAGQRPTTWRALLDLLSPGACDELSTYPWYVEGDCALPLARDAGGGVVDLGTHANAVRRDYAHSEVTFVGVFSEPLAVRRYNRLVERTRNKSVVLIGQVLRVIDRVMRVASAESVRIVVDRLGARMRYREALTDSLPGGALAILEESETRSAYRLRWPDRTCEIEFTTKADDAHFAVALASLYSKYVRELYMHVFNNYWSRRMPELLPTAGYYTDAHRWLKDVDSVVSAASFDRAVLVRSR